MFWDIVLPGIVLYILYLISGILVVTATAAVEDRNFKLMGVALAIIAALGSGIFAIGWSGSRPYFLTRGSAQRMIGSSDSFGDKTEMVFTTGRQIAYIEPGATQALGYRLIPGTDQTVLIDGRKGRDANCIPFDEEKETSKEVWVQEGHPADEWFPGAVACYYNKPSPAGEELFQRLEAQHLLRKEDWSHLYDYVHKPEVKAYVYRVKVGDPTVTVTGIINDGNHAEVDFDFGFSNLNEMGKILFAGTQPEKFSHKAKFTKFDDGWRVTNVDDQLWSFGPRASAMY